MTQNSPNLSQSLIDLQIKMAYLEDTIDHLNDVVARQDRQLTDMQDQLKLMYNHLQNKSEGIAPFDLLADKPPHY